MNVIETQIIQGLGWGLLVVSHGHTHVRDKLQVVKLIDSKEADCWVVGLLFVW